MSTFVLVHGAWHGGWCWKRVRRILQAQGHDVFTPTLTGLAHRSHLLNRSVNLDTHIEDVVNLIRWEELSEVVLCGHSYGGAVISGVAERIPESIAALVYLDAFVLEDGETVLQNVHPAQRQMLIDGASQAGEGWKAPPIPPEVFNLNPGDRAWAARQCTMHPMASLQQPVKLSAGIERISNVTYVFAAGWQDTPFKNSLERAKNKGWRIVTVSCGHEVMLDAPAELANLLAGALPKAATA
jgi:pimeloyl-ACP methyl ester carboxylesterase